MTVIQLFMVKARASSWRRNKDLIQGKLQTASTGVYQGFLILEMRFCMHICYRIIKNTWSQRYIRVLTIKLTIQLFFVDCWKFFPLTSKHMQQSSNMKILRSIWKVKSSSARTTMILQLHSNLIRKETSSAVEQIKFDNHYLPLYNSIFFYTKR